MENLTEAQTRYFRARESRSETPVLLVLAISCYGVALAAVFAFTYSLLNFALRIATQESSVLYSLPR